jgi:hypothetical protein
MKKTTNTNEAYPDNWVNLNLKINKDTNEMHAVGGDQEGPPGVDSPFTGFEILKNMIRDTIFTVTTVYGTSLMDVHSRCIGYYFSEEYAIEAVLQNAGDMNEAGSYPYCVIEEMEQGIYAIPPQKIMWFKWNDEEEGYEQIEKQPEQFGQACCFGIS